MASKRGVAGLVLALGLAPGVALAASHHGGCGPSHHHGGGGFPFGVGGGGWWNYPPYYMTVGPNGPLMMAPFWPIFAPQPAFAGPLGGPMPPARAAQPRQVVPVARVKKSDPGKADQLVTI